jgi:hypothetical protein
LLLREILLELRALNSGHAERVAQALNGEQELPENQ